MNLDRKVQRRVNSILQYHSYWFIIAAVENVLAWVRPPPLGAVTDGPQHQNSAAHARAWAPLNLSLVKSFHNEEERRRVHSCICTVQYKMASWRWGKNMHSGQCHCIGLAVTLKGQCHEKGIIWGGLNKGWPTGFEFFRSFIQNLRFCKLSLFLFTKTVYWFAGYCSATQANSYPSMAHNF